MNSKFFEKIIVSPNLLRGVLNVCFALKLRNTLSLNVVSVEIISNQYFLKNKQQFSTDCSKYPSFITAFSSWNSIGCLISLKPVTSVTTVLVKCFGIVFYVKLSLSREILNAL